MASAMGRWDMAVNGVFVLLLQLVGINLSASLMFRTYGLSARGARYKRGQRWVFMFALAATMVALLGLLTWQFSTSPQLQRSSREQRAVAQIQTVVNDSGLAELVEAEVRFPPANIKGQNTLLGTVYVQRQAGVTESSQEIRSRLIGTIQRQLLEQGFNVTPLIDVSVLEASPS
jgi:uncharacterized membrane protein